MFKNAAKRLATIPALAGNSRLQPLQELIAAEELILHSLQGLSTGFGKTSEALKAWTGGEDEGLENTLSSCSKLLNHWISSFESFATHIASIRECLKDLHSREEALEDLHRCKKSLMAKADPVGKQIGPTSVNKFLERTRVQREILAIDVEIKNKEGSFGDWKRAKAKEWMDVLFGGLLECSEKGTVVATLGRVVIGDLSTEKVQPGLPQVHHSGQTKVEPFAVKAEQKPDTSSFVSAIGDKPEHPSNENRTGGTPPPHSNSLVQSLSQPHMSPTLSNDTRPPPSDQLPPMDSATSRPPLLPQESPGYTPGHPPQLSQNSTPSQYQSGSDLS